MIKAEAEKYTRQCLYNYRANAARLAQKLDKYEIVQHKGSRTEQAFSDGKRASVTYIDSTPEWIEEIELLEQEIPDLRLRVLPIERLLKDLEETFSEMLIVYRLKYEQRMTWETAKEAALKNHQITDKQFRNLHSRLISETIVYLDLRIEIEAVMEMGQKKGLKTA